MKFSASSSAQNRASVVQESITLLGRLNRIWRRRWASFALAGSLLLTSGCQASSNATTEQGGQAANGSGSISNGALQLKGARPITAQDPELLSRPITLAEDRSLSPYFFVESTDKSVDRLPLKATSADVEITGVIADVLVTQVYKNEGKRPIEARYVFPASTRAAVYGMQMTIGERVIQARIQKKAEARATYEAARAAGKSASLLEQHRPNVFEMNVANIMPGDEIKVEMRYTELLVPTDGIYEFVYPTVVGPRYSNATENSQEGMPAQDQEKYVENPHLHAGEATPFTFDVTASLSTGLPIQGIACPSHQVQVEYQGENSATLSLDAADKLKANKDFILRYRLAGGEVQSGVMLYEGQDENYFMVMAQPPKVVKPEYIPAREYIFIMDISGSMNGYPLETAKELMRELFKGLRPQDRFNVELFAGSTALLGTTSLPATPENLQQAIQVIDTQRGGGGTELLPALSRALELPREKGYSRSVVVVTDGYVSVEAKAFDFIREHLGDANFFSFGIGNSVNRFLMEGMARAGQGEPLIVTNPNEARAKAAQFRQYIEAPVLTNVRLNLGSLQAYDVEPAAMVDVLAQRPVVVVGKYRGKASGEVSVEGLSGSGPYRQAFNLSAVKPRAEHQALRYLWARDKIASLADYNRLWANDARIQQVTDLGLRYNLLTDFTSFVAVDSLVRNKEGSELVKQPLPLPEGVSDSAVGVTGGLVGYGSASVRSQVSRGYGMGSGGYGSGAGRMAAANAVAAPAEKKVEYRSHSLAALEAPVASAPAMDMGPSMNAPGVTGASSGAGKVGSAGPKGSAGAGAKGDVGIARDEVTRREPSAKDKEASQPQIKSGAYFVRTGDVNTQELADALKKLMPQLMAEYRKALASQPSLAGTVKLILSMTNDGKLTIVLRPSSGDLMTSSALKAGLERLLNAGLAKLPSMQAGDVVECQLHFTP